ncbi:hypothetical protein [Methanoculleus sp. 10]|jgi:hypothetical protein|nr:hypothetical protein [Methanoculleus sp. 10]MBP7410700.1 hypothetical protein [Methanoculleus sp.]
MQQLSIRTVTAVLLVVFAGIAPAAGIETAPNRNPDVGDRPIFWTYV